MKQLLNATLSKVCIFWNIILRYWDPYFCCYLRFHAYCGCRGGNYCGYLGGCHGGYHCGYYFRYFKHHLVHDNFLPRLQQINQYQFCPLLSFSSPKV